jgi:hypothetical protein
MTGKQLYSTLKSYATHKTANRETLNKHFNIFRSHWLLRHSYLHSQDLCISEGRLSYACEHENPNKNNRLFIKYTTVEKRLVNIP